MAQVISKLAPIGTTCVEFVHPWTNSCLEATCGLYFYSIFSCLRLYTTVYAVTTLMRGKMITLKDLKKVVSGIIQSTAFLSATAFGYSLFLCTLRKLFSNFNILTVSGIPAFLSSVFAILIERPSRRTLLALYVSNVATETVWNMLLTRKWVRSVPYGEVLIFAISAAPLLMYYKNGNAVMRNDSMFNVINFAVGPYEQYKYTENQSAQVNCPVGEQPAQDLSQNCESTCRPKRPRGKSRLFHIVMEALRMYKRLINRIKCCDRHASCSHPFSCVYYSLQGAVKMFALGVGLQAALKMLFQMQRVFTAPSSLKKILFRRDLFNVGAFLGGFCGLFRGGSCLLRRFTGKDDQYQTLVAALVAGLTFAYYPDSTVALYVMWKTLQITYNIGIENGYVPKVPGFTILLYCFSTAVLFHAAMLEPTSLRPNYWRFLCDISGGRIACMTREPLDAWGLNTSKSLAEVLRNTRTVAEVQFYGPYK